MQGSFIRTAHPRDFERISEAGVFSMNKDPLVTSYFGCDTPASVKSYILFTLHSTWQVGGLIDIMCLPSRDAEHDEEIIAVVIWLPPRIRVTSWNVYTLLRSGILSLTQAIGAQYVMRMEWEYPSIAEQSWNEGRFCLDDGPTWSHNDSWYLKMAFTAQPYQKKGMMSKLIEYRLERLGPDFGFTLEASCPRIQNYFRHFNFEVMNRSKIGVGYLDEAGNQKSGGAGLDVSYMIKKASPDADPWGN